MTKIKMNVEDVASNNISSPSSQFNLLLGPDCDLPYVHKEKCPMCNVYQSTFSCKECVVSGNFSKPKDCPETFARMAQRFRNLKGEKMRRADRCRELLQKRTMTEELPKRISDCRERVQALKYLIQEKRDAVKDAKKNLEATQERNNCRRNRMPRYKERVEKLANYVNINMRNEIFENRKRLEKCQSQLKKIVQKNVEHLVQYVFPIVKINPTSKSASDDEVVSALAEASKTSFVRGTWVLMDSSGELHHQIVAPTLPGSGDYSAYLATDNDNGVPIMEKISTNEAYNIGAALCYTTQLVNLLAFYLDIILPKKVTYGDFCVKELTEKQFQRLVARLNSNVLYLCFSQGMDSVLLNPKHTLNNVLHLVQDADLGRVGPFHVDSGLVLSLECDGGDGRGEDDLEDEEDHFPWEWEAIPLVACPESVPGSAMSSTQATTSIAGGLVTSLASMFRGWAGSSKMLPEDTNQDTAYKAFEKSESDDDATQVNTQDFQRLNDISSRPMSPPSEPLLPKFGLSEPYTLPPFVDSGAQTELLFPEEVNDRTEHIQTLVQVLQSFSTSKDLGYLRMEKRGIDEVYSSPGNSDRSKMHCSQTQQRRPVIPGETIRYALRKQNEEGPYANAFSHILNYVGEEVLLNPQHVADNWSGSFVEACVQCLLTTARIAGSAKWEQIHALGRKILQSVVTEAATANVQESRIAILLEICQSSEMCYELIPTLLDLFRDLQEGCASADRSEAMDLMELSYFILNALSQVLLRLETFLGEGASNTLTSPVPKNNVMLMWRNQWRPAIESSPSPPPVAASPVPVWLEQLDRLLIKEIGKSPLVASILMECLETVKRIDRR